MSELARQGPVAPLAGDSHAAAGTPRVILLVAAYVGLLLNAPTWWLRLHDTYLHVPPLWASVGAASEAALVLATTTLLLVPPALAGRWIWRLVASSFIVISGLCAYFMSVYQVVIGYGVVQAVLTTDHDMSSELVGWKLLLWLLMLGLLPALWLWRRAPPPSLWWLWRTRGRSLPGLLALIALSAALMTGARKGLDHVAPMVRNDSTELVANLEGVAAHTYVPSNWISGAAMVAANTLTARSRAQHMVAPADKFHYEPSVPLDDIYLVVVIGETARHDHMGMLGYTRDTTPLMGALPGVAAFRATSCDTVTKLSLACMFVRPEGMVQSDGLQPDVILEETVFSVLKALGFTIELFAMQSEVGLYQLMQPDSYKMREMIFADPQHAQAARNDLLLVDELKADLLRHPQGRHVSILHLKGSHFLYTQRYPREFAHWQPECPDVDSACSKESLVNSFDNSIAFTDHVLAQIVKALQGRRALLVYSSDHGESIDEHAHFHGTPRSLAPPEQRRVPLLIWASPALRTDARLAPGYANLRARAAQDVDGRTTHANLFASILGCLGVRSIDGGITGADDLCDASARY